MKKSRPKQWLVCLLAVLLAFTLVPATVFADGPASPRATDAVTVRGTDGTEEGYATLFEAADAAADGDTLLLNEDLEMGFFELNGKQQSPTMVVEGKSLTLDGQGHTVTAKNEAFSMIEVRATGALTIQDIVMDGSSAENRSFSNILNIEGGRVTIEDGVTLKNNRTSAINIGTNVPGGVCVMNGGTITENVMPAGSSSTGVAVTVLEESTFIMNGGTISNNQTLKYGSPGIMVTRGGKAVLNDGVIEGNQTNVAANGSAVTIKGGEVELNGTVIRNNTSAASSYGAGYGAIYVKEITSFEDKWPGVLTITGGEITGNQDADGNPNAIYLWSSIEDVGAYLKLSGSPKIEGSSIIYANNSSSIYYRPIEVVDTFTPVVPVELDSLFYYIIGQEMVTYAPGLQADSNHFKATDQNYGYQEAADQTYLYTEARREVLFMDGTEEIEALSRWTFVEDLIAQPEYSKIGYALDGWYTDAALTQPWNFEEDTLPREEGVFRLYAKWSPLPAQAPVLPEEIQIDLSCGDEDGTTLTPSFQEEEGYTYSYLWQNANGEALGEDSTLAVPSPAHGESATYLLTVTATRADNGQTAQSSTTYVVSRTEHQVDPDWTYDETSHWNLCSLCGERFHEGPHTFQWVIDREATATQAGSKHEACTVCGYAKAAVDIPATGAGDPDAPQTGDSSNLALWTAVMAVAAGAALLSRRKREQR